MRDAGRIHSKKCAPIRLPAHARPTETGARRLTASEHTGKPHRMSTDSRRDQSMMADVS